jgi:hypothetical protein
MVLGKREDPSRKGPLEVLSIYFCMGQKKYKEESRNNETLFFHAYTPAAAWKKYQS